MEKTKKALDFIISWLVVLLPFSIAIAPAPMNVFMGLLIASFLVKKIVAKEIIFEKEALNFLLVIFFLSVCLSVINTVSFKDSLKGGILRALQFIFVFFALSAEVKDKRQIKRIIFSVAAGLTLTSIDCIWQVATGKDFIRGYAPIVNIGLTRATASFKDANTLGIYLSAVAPLILGCALFYYKSVKKFLLLCVGALSVLGIALTYSRPTLLALYLSILFLALIRKKKACAAALVVFALISPFLLPRSVKEFARQVDYNPVRFMCNDDRIAVFRNTLNMIREHPLIGVGANTYMKNYKTYKDAIEYRGVVTSELMYAHNNFLHMAAETGILGLLVFLCWLFCLFKKAKQAYCGTSDNFIKIVALSLSACLIAFLVNGLTESSLYYSRVAIIFWYLAGFLAALSKFIDASKFHKD